jgi:hypothetical protein
MARYSIMVIEYGSNREIELCQVQSNPEATVEAVKAKTLMVYAKEGGRRRSAISKYSSVRIVDREPPAA